MMDVYNPYPDYVSTVSLALEKNWISVFNTFDVT